MAQSLRNKLKAVESTNLWKIHYDNKAMVLYVVFLYDKQTVYAYKGVPGHIWHSLKHSESKGEYFARSVKPRFSFTKRPLS